MNQPPLLATGKFQTFAERSWASGSMRIDTARRYETESIPTYHTYARFNAGEGDRMDVLPPPCAMYQEDSDPAVRSHIHACSILSGRVHPSIHPSIHTIMIVLCSVIIQKVVVQWVLVLGILIGFIHPSTAQC